MGTVTTVQVVTVLWQKKIRSAVVKLGQILAGIVDLTRIYKLPADEDTYMFYTMA